MGFTSPFARSIGIADDEPVAPPLGKRGWIDAAGDTLDAAASGVGGLIKSGGTLYGLATGDMDNAATELGGSVQGYWQDRYSPQLKAKIAERSAKIDESEGILGKAGTALWETVRDPALLGETAASNVATLLPAGLVGRGAAAVRTGMGMRAAGEAGLAPEAATALARSAGKWGTAAAIGTGGVQQGAEVSQSAYEGAMQQSDDDWAQNPEFIQTLRQRVAQGGNLESLIPQTKHEFALQAARATMPAATAISVGANLIPGANLLEKALVGAPRGLAKEGVRFGLVRSIGKGMVGESAQEAIEEGGGQFAGNVARMAYTNPNQDLSEGVGENAGMGAAGGLLFGAFGGAMQRGRRSEANSQEQAPTIAPEIEQNQTGNLLAPPAPNSDGFDHSPYEPLVGPRAPAHLGLQMPTMGTSDENWVNTEQPRAPDASLSMQSVPGTGIQQNLFNQENSPVSPAREQVDFGTAGPSVEAMRQPLPQGGMGSQAVRDAVTGDMFEQNPTSMVRTMFNPEVEPSDTQGRKTRGAVAGAIRSTIAQQIGKVDAFTTKLSLDISALLGDTAALNKYVADENAKQQKELEKLDRKVSMGSDMLSPEEYATKRQAIEDRQLAIMAAGEVVASHNQAMTNAMAREGITRAAPGQQVASAQQGNATEQQMRSENMNRQADEVSGRSTPNEMDPNLVKERGPAPLQLTRYTQADLDERANKQRWANGPAEKAQPAQEKNPAQGELFTKSGAPARKRSTGTTNANKQAAAPTAAPETTASAPTQQAAPATKSNAPVGEKPANGATASKPATAPARSEANNAPVAATATQPTEAKAEPSLEDAKKIKKLTDAIKRYESILDCLAIKR